MTNSPTRALLLATCLGIFGCGGGGAPAPTTPVPGAPTDPFAPDPQNPDDPGGTTASDYEKARQDGLAAGRTLAEQLRNNPDAQFQEPQNPYLEDGDGPDPALLEEICGDDLPPDYFSEPPTEDDEEDGEQDTAADPAPGDAGDAADNPDAAEGDDGQNPDAATGADADKAEADKAEDEAEKKARMAAHWECGFVQGLNEPADPKDQVGEPGDDPEDNVDVDEDKLGDGTTNPGGSINNPTTYKACEEGFELITPEKIDVNRTQNSVEVVMTGEFNTGGWGSGSILLNQLPTKEDPVLKLLTCAKSPPEGSPVTQAMVPYKFTYVLSGLPADVVTKVEIPADPPKTASVPKAP